MSLSAQIWSSCTSKTSDEEFLGIPEHVAQHIISHITLLPSTPTRLRLMGLCHLSFDDTTFHLEVESDEPEDFHNAQQLTRSRRLLLALPEALRSSVTSLVLGSGSILQAPMVILHQLDHAFPRLSELGIEISDAGDWSVLLTLATTVPKGEGGPRDWLFPCLRELNLLSIADEDQERAVFDLFADIVEARAMRPGRLGGRTDATAPGLKALMALGTEERFDALKAAYRAERGISPNIYYDGGGSSEG